MIVPSEAMKIIIENQIRLTEDMIVRINIALSIAQQSNNTVKLTDGTEMPKAHWLAETNIRKADYEKDLEALKKLLRG